MTRDSDLPQTVDAAEACGWQWLTAECKGCRHRGDVKLAGLAPSMRLAVLTRKLTCQGCKGRQVRVSLGTYIIGEGTQPWADYRRIAFEGNRVVRPARE